MRKNDPLKKAEKRASTLRKLLSYLKKDWGYLALSLFFSLVSVTCMLAVPILIGEAINSIDLHSVDFDRVCSLLIVIGCLVLGSALSQWLASLSNNRLTFCMVQSVRRDAIRKIERLPLSYIDSHPYGDVVSRVIADVDQVGEGLLMGFTQLFTGALTIVGTLVMMVILNRWVALAVVVLTPLSLFVAKFISGRTYHLFKNQSAVRGEQTAFVDEMISGQKVVRAFGREKENEETFDEINARLGKCSLMATFFSSLTNPSTRVVNNTIYAAVALIGAFFVIDGGLSVGSLNSLLSYANQYMKPFNEISGVVTELQGSLASADRMFEFLEERELSLEADGELPPVLGNVALEHIAFSYTKDRPLIRDFDLTVRAGQRVAIVGPTGCGKTTLINLLMRFYDVDEGRITVEGTDIRDVPRRELRKEYGMVLQETWLKNATVRENIVMGKPSATEEEVIAAATAAHAHEFILRLPKGYDTVLTDDALSQGQRQLLCIARIMLSLPPMLILDEATSSIDTRTELAIQNAFSEMMKGRTSFIVAHRLSTIREADTILVMKDGNVVEQGRHEELLARRGFYASLYQAQFEG
ncbi:MAG: ABC transporter ATP-binding protein [Christensenellaceae bacterium]